ncbi:MAG: TonB-dependent receptor plug domain-containing protein [Bacteroidales bacterium]|nr:TonB-dependent receptor plug domain-containing protein [Bacteroidales bacterium]
MKAIKEMALISMLMIAMSTTAQNNDKLLNGIVTDLAGEPLRKVKAYIKSPKIYTVSDKKGRFGLTEVNDDDTLHLVYKKEHYIIPLNGHKGVRIKLGDQLNAISEADEKLVYIGYGFVKRREHMGSTNTITREELERTGQTFLMAALQSRVPNLSIISNSVPGQKSMVSIRGIDSVYGDPTPLYLIDGMPVESLDGIFVQQVESVDIIKDSNIYGARGSNGVISVQSRKH